MALLWDVRGHMLCGLGGGGGEGGERGGMSKGKMLIKN